MRDKLGRFIKGHPQLNTGRTHFKKGRKLNSIPKGAFKKGHIGYWKGKKGENASQWKSGRCKDKRGYIYIYKPTHPFATKAGYIKEHRLIVESQIGRYLEPNEIPHHINEIRDDNRPENLMLFKNGMYHFWFHKKGFCNPKGIIFDGRHL